MPAPILIDVGDGTLIVPPPAQPPPPPQPAPPEPPPTPAPTPSQTIPLPGVIYLPGDDVGGPPGSIVPEPPAIPAPPTSGGDGGAGGAVPATDDLATSAAIANANDPDLSDLEPLEILDPFGFTFLAVANPPLKGGGALSAIAQACADYGVDTRAVVADAIHEGAGGGIGDGGWAYGPFQDHLTQFAGRPFYGKGKDNPVVNAWAWSENGIRYSVRQMATAKPSARGLTGHPAVYAIVYGYERPQDKAGAYRTRAAEYDTLAAKGSGWAQYAAALFAGPQAGGGVDTTPLPPTTQPAYTPAGVTQQWRNLIDVFKLSVPAKRQAVASLASSLKEVFR